MFKLKRKKGGFTLIELVMVIVILGILFAISIPKYVDLTKSAKAATLKANLGTIKSVIYISYANSAVSGAATFPATISGDLFSDDQVPEEPFTPSRNVVTAYDGTGGWVYDSTTGKVHPNIEEYRDL